MTRCWNCDRPTAARFIIDGHSYCRICAPDVSQTGGDSHLDNTARTANTAGKVPDPVHVARVGTVSVDPATGEHVMAPDFLGDEELRWPLDPALTDDVACIVTSCLTCGTITDIDYGPDTSPANGGEPAPEPDQTSSCGSADYRTSRTLSVPLAEQIRLYGERIESVLDALHDNLESEWFRQQIIEMGAHRLVENYANYGSAMYGWDADRRDKEMFEEVADWGVMGTSGDFFKGTE